MSRARSWPDLHRAPSARPAEPGTITFRPRSGRRALRPGLAFRRGDQARAGHAVFDHENRLQLAALRDRRRRESPASAGAERERRAAEHAGPQRRATRADRSSRCRCEKRHPPPARFPKRGPRTGDPARRALPSPAGRRNCRQPRFVHRRFQPIGALALDGQQRSTGNRQVARLHRSRGDHARERRGECSA